MGSARESADYRTRATDSASARATRLKPLSTNVPQPPPGMRKAHGGSFTRCCNTSCSVGSTMKSRASSLDGAADPAP